MVSTCQVFQGGVGVGTTIKVEPQHLALGNEWLIHWSMHILWEHTINRNWNTKKILLKCRAILLLDAFKNHHTKNPKHFFLVTETLFRTCEERSSEPWSTMALLSTNLNRFKKYYTERKEQSNGKNFLPLYFLLSNVYNHSSGDGCRLECPAAWAKEL